MQVLEGLQGLKEQQELLGSVIDLQSKLVDELKTRARTLEIAVTKGWHVGK